MHGSGESDGGANSFITGAIDFTAGSLGMYNFIDIKS